MLRGVPFYYANFIDCILGGRFIFPTSGSKVVYTHFKAHFTTANIQLFRFRVM